MKLRLLSALLFIACTVRAQIKAPEWGKVSKEDLLMKECPMDKSASAMVLGDEGVVEFNWDPAREQFEMQKKVRTRIKIFNDKGLEWADNKIVFTSDDKYEQVSGVSGEVYNLDNSGELVVTKLSKDQVFKKREDATHSSVTFTMPGVKNGSVLEYRYTIVKKTFRYIDPWIFQRPIPTRFSSYEIEVPQFFVINPMLTRREDTRLEKSEQSGNRTIAMPGGIGSMGVTRYRYTFNDVAALVTEPYMSGFKDYLQRIELQLMRIVVNGQVVADLATTWQKLADGLYESDYFGTQIRKKVNIDELDKELEGKLRKKDRIESIFRFVRNRFEWNGDHDFYCENVKETAEKRVGSTGDINLVLLNLLKHNDIEAYPLLVSTRQHGHVYTLYPSLQQFNSLNVLAKDENDHWYVMNAADKHNPINLIPDDVISTEGLRAEKNQSTWITLWDIKMIEKHNVSYMGVVGDDGSITGDAFLTSGGYAKTERLKALKNGTDKYISAVLATAQGINIEDFTTKNADNDTLDLEQKFKFKMKASASGDYIYFNANLFTGLENNPFVSDKRISDIDFGHNRRISLSTRLVFPESYTLEELPKNIRMIMPDTSISFSRSYFKEENTVILRMLLEFNRPTFSAEEYPEFREFYQKLYEMLNEQVVLKKKK